MKKLSIILSLTATFLVANDLNLKRAGVDITYEDDNGEKQIVAINRGNNHKCRKVNGMDPNVVWGGDFARKDVPSDCKKTFVTTVGIISPMTIAPGVKTYGELEVIDFIQKSQHDENLLLVDARMPNWYVQKTIPTAINMSFKSFDPKHQDFEVVLDNTNVEYEDGVYDFTNAKTLLLFCNGIWCPQSVWAIENLIKIGYPKEKLLWYRGGLTSWTTLNLTTVVP